jgi:hypothetical protein
MASARSRSIIVIDDDIAEVDDDLEILDYGRILFHVLSLVLSVRILCHILFSWLCQLQEKLKFGVFEKPQNVPGLFGLFILSFLVVDHC